MRKMENDVLQQQLAEAGATVPIRGVAAANTPTDLGLILLTWGQSPPWAALSAGH